MKKPTRRKRGKRPARKRATGIQPMIAEYMMWNSLNPPGDAAFSDYYNWGVTANG